MSKQYLNPHDMVTITDVGMHELYAWITGQ